MPDDWSDHEAERLNIKEHGGKVREYNVDDLLDVGISPEKNRQALREQPQKFAYFSSLYAAAVVQAQRAKENVKRTELRLNKKVRQVAADAGEKVTEGAIESLVKNNKEYIDAVDKHLEAMAQEEVLDGIRESLYQRHQVLITLLNNSRPEIDTDPGARIDRARRHQ